MKLTLMIIVTLVTAGLLSANSFAQCGGSSSKVTTTATTAKDQAASMTQKAEKLDIVQTAVNAGNFTTLVAAVEAAGLVETLQGEGPFTVFAPSDEAFAKLPEGTIENLLKDKKALTAVLTYHVVPGKVLAADVVKLKTAETANGQAVTINASDKGVMVDKANVIATDILCDNGVIHVIDEVILPEMTE